MSFSIGAFMLIANRAEAQVATEWQGAATAGTGVTTNVANTGIPDRRAPKGTVVPEWDGFGFITPALQLTVETKRATQLFVAGLDYHYYFRHHEANAFSSSLSYGLSAVLSPTVDFSLGLSGAETQASVFNLVGAGETAQALPTQGGDNYLFTGGVSESLSVAMSDLDTFSEGGSFSGNDDVPTGPVPANVHPPRSTQTYIATGTLGYAHSFRRDSFGTLLGTDVGVYPDLAVAGSIIPQHTDLIHRAELTWHHEYSADWSTIATAGAMAAYQAVDLHPIFEPIGTAAIDYTNRRGAVALTYSHDAQPNIILGETMFGDDVALRGLMPLERGFDLSGAADFLASRPLLAKAQGGAFGTTTYMVVVDAALGYQREHLPLRFELRYQFSRQIPGKSPPCSATEPPPCSKPVFGEIIIPEIRRQNLGVAVTYYFPQMPPLGVRGPSVVPLPVPSSNPGALDQPPPTRAQLEDAERKGASDRKKQSEKQGEKTSEPPEGAPSEGK